MRGGSGLSGGRGERGLGGVIVRMFDDLFGHIFFLTCIGVRSREECIYVFVDVD